MHSVFASPVARRKATVIALAALFCAPALAFEIDVGNPDIEMRWDNTLRYNLGGRAQKQNPAILLAPNNDDGDRNFSNGSLVTNRLDILSEFDFVWQKSYGARVSAAQRSVRSRSPTTTTGRPCSPRGSLPSKSRRRRSSAGRPGPGTRR